MDTKTIDEKIAELMLEKKKVKEQQAQQIRQSKAKVAEQIHKARKNLKLTVGQYYERTGKEYKGRPEEREWIMSLYMQFSSVAAIANDLGMTLARLYQIEAGRSYPTREEMAAIEKLYGIKLDAQ